MRIKNKKKKVDKFVLDTPDDKSMYEAIMNSDKITIVREEFAYDKLGRAVVTIWYEEDD